MGTRGIKKLDPYQETLVVHELEGFEPLRPTARKESIKRGWQEIGHPQPMVPRVYGALNDEPILIYASHAFRCEAYRKYEYLILREITNSSADKHLCLVNMGDPFVNMDDVVDIHMCRGVFARMHTP